MSEYIKITPDEFGDQYVKYIPVPEDDSSFVGLVQVLRNIRRGEVASALDERFPPVPIISSTRTLRDGRRVRDTFYVDFSNITQHETAQLIRKGIKIVLDSGDSLRMSNFYANLLNLTRSNYE